MTEDENQSLAELYGTQLDDVLHAWQDTNLCEYLARGFCAASVDGYCVGGTADGHCHG